jgi:predicted O-methyltransferase YrrM
MNTPVTAARPIFNDYIKILKRCENEHVDDSTILTLVNKAQDYIRTLKQSDEATADEVRIVCSSSRRSAATLLTIGTWLAPSTRKAIEEFIGAQPEFVDDQYRFTLNLGREYTVNWEQVLKSFAGRPNLQFLEIGSFEGQSACWLFENVLTHPASRLTCIDLFDSVERKLSLFATHTDSFGMSYYQRFLHNINVAQAKDRVHIIADSSAHALRSLPLNSYDFIYIDGSHLAKDVIRDTILAWDLLKCDGILIFDDYKWQSPYDPSPLGSPAIAIDSFLQIFEGEYRKLHHDYQVICQKTV